MVFTVKARSGSYEYDTEIKTVSYWTGRTHMKVPARRDTLKQFVENYTAGDNVVINGNGELSSYSATPGYCDGDRTTTIDSIKALIV